MSKLFVLRARIGGVTREIKFRVDDEDAAVVRPYAWRFVNSEIIRKEGKITKYLTHEIMRPPEGFNVYRLNRDGLDYRKGNLIIGRARREVDQTQCLHGHSLPENAYYLPDGTMGYCRRCNNIATLRYKHKQKILRKVAA